MRTDDYTKLYNNEAEQAVLGALILESNAYYDVSPILSPDMFYSDIHKVLYGTIEQMNAGCVPVDMVTVTEELKKRAKLTGELGPVYIAELTGRVASHAHIVQHAMYIKQEYLRREMLTIAQSSMRDIFNGTDIADILSETARRIQVLEEGASVTDTLKHIREYAMISIDEAEKRTVNYRSGAKNGITTGMRDLDRITGGWQNGELTVIAARPAMGKTAVAIKLLEAAALAGHDVVMFALEMKGERLTDRIILEKTGIKDWFYKQGGLSNDELAAIADTSSYLYNLPVFIDDNSCRTISSIKSKSRLLKQKGKCKLIIIDYLQLIEGAGAAGSREQEVAQISREAKKMAKSLDVPVIMLSQLNRALEARADKRPMLSDLRESGAIEQDADMVMFIHRPEYYGRKLEYKGAEIINGMELIIAKYREGATGSIFLQHDGSVRNISDYK